MRRKATNPLNHTFLQVCQALNVEKGGKVRVVNNAASGDTIDSGSGFHSGAGNSQPTASRAKLHWAKVKADVFKCGTINGLSDSFLKLYNDHIKGLSVPPQDESQLRVFKAVAYSNGERKFVSLIPALMRAARQASNPTGDNILMQSNTEFRGVVEQLFQDQANKECMPTATGESWQMSEMLDEIGDRDDMLDEAANLVLCRNYCFGALTPHCVSERQDHREACVE